MRQLFFDENCANTKTHPFAIYAIWTFDEINSHSFPLLLYLTILQILIPPSHKYWIPDIEKLETIYTHKFCYACYEISANYPFFSTSNLIGIQQYQFLYPTVELAKLSITYPWRWLKFKQGCISHQVKLC